MKIKKGDTVEIISGRNKGQIGKIYSILKNKDKVTIKDVNLKIKHIKPQQKEEKGKIEKIEGPIHLSNIKLKKD